MGATTTLLQVMVILTVLIGGGFLAKTYFRKAKVTKEDKEIWKKNAVNHNKELDAAYNKKDDKSFNDFLHPKVSRFMPKIPYRIEGAAEMMKKIKTQMEAVGGSTSVMQTNAELYNEVLVVTYNFMTEGKLGDKFVEGSGKVTRVWAHLQNGWKLVHEHISEN